MKMLKKVKKKLLNLSEKTKIVLINIIGAFVIKGVSLIVSLLTTPTYITFFNNEIVLGIWFTILSVISWFLNFDLGIGNGLRNHLTKAYAEKDYKEAKKLISSAYAVIGAVCIAIIVVVMISFDYVEWNKFFRIDRRVVSEKALLTTVKIVFIGIVLQIFFKIISSILYAIQKSSINNAISLATSLLILIVISISPSSDNNHNLVFMAVIYDISVILPYIIASIVVFYSKRYRIIAPKLSLVSQRHATKVLVLGGSFFLVQIFYMLIMSTNEYLITYCTNSGNVVEYRIYYQILTLGSTICALALTPVWSAITKAIAEKDVEWIKKLYRKMIMGAVVGTACEFLLILVLQNLFNIWLRDSTITVNYITAVSFAFLGSLMLFNAVFSNVANGVGKLRTQLVVFFSGIVVKIPLTVVMIRITDSWVGVVIATNIILLTYCIIQPITLHRFFNSKSWNKK